MRPTSGRRRPGARVAGPGAQAGVALLLAVWLLALLAVVAGEFVFSTRVKAAAERNARDDLKAWALALAGYRAALAALDDRIAGLSVDGDGGLLLHYRGETGGTPAAAKDVPLGEGKYSWRIADEDGLVNINTVQQRALLVNLLRECGMEPGVERDTVVDSILDWRDPTPEHRLNGAEEEYYRGLDPPYSCKDGAFSVVEELLLVRGVTRELFFGTRAQGRDLPGLRDLVSVHSLQLSDETAPRGVLDAHGRRRPTRLKGINRDALTHFRIIATGEPGGGAPPRTLLAIVQRREENDKRIFTLLYLNESTSPAAVGREGEN